MTSTFISVQNFKQQQIQLQEVQMQVEELSLRQLIKQTFLQNPDLCKKRQLNLTTPFYCIVYISDGQICIQTIFPDFMKVWQHAKPINNQRTPFYNTFRDCAKVFNCPIEMLNSMDQKYPSVYHPAFHFKSRQQDYKKQRLAIKLPKDMRDMLYVKQWSIHIVNIGNTSFFSPVIKIKSYQAIRKPKQEFYEIPTSILFQPYLAKVMQEARVKQLRQHYKSNPKTNNFIITKEYPYQTSNVNMSRLSFLDAHDSKIKSPAFKNCSQTFYIYIGERPKKNHYYHFKKPLGNTYKNIDVGDIRRHQTFYDQIIPVNQQDQIQQQGLQYFTLLNEDDQPSQKENKSQNQDSDCDSESSDPLRKLYKRMLIEDNKSGDV